MFKSAAGYAEYQQWLAGTQLEQRVPWKIIQSRIAACDRLVGHFPNKWPSARTNRSAGVDLFAPFSPQLEEMERFAERSSAEVPP